MQADTIEDPETEINGATPIADETDNNELDLTNEVVSFPTNCPECHEPCTTNMKVSGTQHLRFSTHALTSIANFGFSSW